MQERLHELDVCLYVRELSLLFPENTEYRIADYYNMLQSAHGREAPSAETFRNILCYDRIERYELVSYFYQRGYTPKQIAQIIGITSKTVSNILAREYPTNPMTLQRWLNNLETGNDMYGVRQATKVAELIVPPRDLTAILR